MACERQDFTVTHAVIFYWRESLIWGLSDTLIFIDSALEDLSFTF